MLNIFLSRGSRDSYNFPLESAGDSSKLVLGCRSRCRMYTLPNKGLESQILCRLLLSQRMSPTPTKMMPVIPCLLEQVCQFHLPSFIGMPWHWQHDVRLAFSGTIDEENEPEASQ
jgi:hypothetical protein